GTVGLEIAQQCNDLGIVPDQVLVNCGGGGLISGSATALKANYPDVAVHPVEPEGFDDTARSLRSGKREHVDPKARSICDALQAYSPGEMTFAINRKLLAEGLVVSDAEVRAAMRFAFLNLKLVVEPGGAAALAALLSGKLETRDRTTVVVISGGNVDAELFAEIQREDSG
ncbi:MAG: pyridoxal-phosphate dependent enzyme, partial [Gammaproteobacteria bacterium]|nr:pyridoxal-phosphate dependent enzyme [Gammaproteobacteria bacterium]